MLDHPSPPNLASDKAFVAEHFNEADCNDKIVAEITRRHDAENPGAHVSKIEAEVASEDLASRRGELQRVHAEKQSADYLTEKHASGPRQMPLTLHGHVNYLTFSVPSLFGVFVATYVLAVYAADAGVIAALDNNLLAAFLMAFPVIAAGQAVKAAGSLQKNDAAKARYYSRVAKLATLALVLFVLGMVVTFAPQPVDPAVLRETLTTGVVPKANAFVTFCKDVCPYLTVGAGLFAEILAAAVIGHRADAINAFGRSVSQDVTVTQNLLDQRIAALNRKIKADTKKLGRCRADVARNDAARAARITAAQVYARELRARYAAHKAKSDSDFLTTL